MTLIGPYSLAIAERESLFIVLLDDLFQPFTGQRNSMRICLLNEFVDFDPSFLIHVDAYGFRSVSEHEAQKFADPDRFFFG